MKRIADMVENALLGAATMGTGTAICILIYMMSS